MSFLNPLIVSNAGGMLLGNTAMRGQAAFGSFDIVSIVSVALSIPLMLFTLDVRSWGRARTDTFPHYAADCGHQGQVSPPV